MSAGIPLIDEMNEAFFSDLGLELKLLRLDLIHPSLGGNKWFKLRYNLEELNRLGKRSLLTFGGAYSNHIAAVAAAGKEFGFNTIGIIRGEACSPLNGTLSLATEQGMELHYTDRQLYRDKDALLQWVSNRFGSDIYVLPEGGSNNLGVKGCTEILDTVQIRPDFFCCACGTGATLAGIASSEKGKGRSIGFSALKGGSFLQDAISQFVGEEVSGETRIITDYHFGGYGKIKPELINFVGQIMETHGIQLDYAYTGKMMFGIYDLAGKGFFPKGSQIMAIHSGGVQGNAGYDDKRNRNRAEKEGK
jgi:1-aminocyclopropane-1-carboxylate deaminase/D-cysteine desulfhydrase-like pyridoxal-dependent ACC family enzyme